jgi:cytochrome c556
MTLRNAYWSERRSNPNLKFGPAPFLIIDIRLKVVIEGSACSKLEYDYTAVPEYSSMAGKNMSRVPVSIILFVLFGSSLALAGSDPIKSRQHLMEETRDAAKVIGGMLKKQKPFDAEAAMESFKVWQNTAMKAGDLFPEGSDKGHETEARMTIWTDREGFDAKMGDFRTRVDAAIAASPDSLEALNAAAGPVFKACKACHEEYRVEKED